MSAGLHHITAIASDARRNVDFYEGVLGLRLVKKTVNFDDPGTYHLYYGDAIGSPGSILTFFPYAGAQKGKHGIGQAVEISFAIPEAAFSFWIGRLHEKGVAYRGPDQRFGEKLIRFEDPDGLKLEIVAVRDAESYGAPWETDGITKEAAIRGFHSVTLWEVNPETAAMVLTSAFGYREEAREDARVRYRSRERGLASIVDIAHAGDLTRGFTGAGVNHHIAFRAEDDAHQQSMRGTLLQLGLDVTGVLDRQYFHSVYFREPGGVLFEIATDPPGFTVDEPVESLGEALKLPPQYEPRRADIERVLVPLT